VNTGVLRNHTIGMLLLG